MEHYFELEVELVKICNFKSASSSSCCASAHSPLCQSSGDNQKLKIVLWFQPSMVKLSKALYFQLDLLTLSANKQPKKINK